MLVNRSDVPIAFSVLIKLPFPEVGTPNEVAVVNTFPEVSTPDNEIPPSTVPINNGPEMVPFKIVPATIQGVDVSMNLGRNNKVEHIG